jgi:hypothetical protein
MFTVLPLAVQASSGPAVDHLKFREIYFHTLPTVVNSQSPLSSSLPWGEIIAIYFNHEVKTTI